MELAALILATIAATAPAAPATARSHHYASPAILDSYGVPDPLLTPGGIDPAATLDVICTTTKPRRSVTMATRAKVLRDYNQPSATTEDYKLDHLIPLYLGGNNAAANLRPQPAPDYHVKDALELAVPVKWQASAAHRCF